MKSQANGLFQVALGVFADIRAAYPQMRGLDRDVHRLTSLVEQRGLGVFVLDLPTIDEALLQGLENGQLVLGFPNSRSVSKKIRVPRFLSGLWLRVFDKSGVLRNDADPTAIFFLRQISCLGKKLEVGCSPERLRKAIDEYHKIEAQTREPTLSWLEDQLDIAGSAKTLRFDEDIGPSSPPLFDDSEVYTIAQRGRLSVLVRRLHHICDEVSQSIGMIDPYAASAAYERENRGIGVKHGPGAVSDMKTGEYKYKPFSHWPDKLQHRFPYDAFGVVNPDVILRDDHVYPLNHELPSKLCVVPKTAKGPRLIASEPRAHQWCQQLLMRELVTWSERKFRGDFITIRNQEPSRKMVHRASLDGKLATLDLSSASDRLSLWVIERVFRRNPDFLELIHSVRTRWVVDRISDPKSPRFLKLRKFATQGSALTFPIQSIVFLCCALSVLPEERSLEDYRRKWGSQVRVFGDDIIIPKAGYADLCLLLHYLGLKVNENKSFSSGFFRESCGQDSYKGYDVTPVKVNRLGSDEPTAVVSLIDYANNLFLKGLWHAARAAESMLPMKVVKNLPVRGLSENSGSISIDQYISSFKDPNALPLPVRELIPEICRGAVVGGSNRISFSGSKLDHLSHRWNNALHRIEVRALRFETKVARKSVDSLSSFLQFLTEAPSPLTKWKSGVDGRPKTRERLGWVPLLPASSTTRAHH